MARTRSVGEDRLRRHDFDPSSLGGFVVAREPDDVDAVIGENESTGRRIALVIDLDRDSALSARQDRRHEPARPGLDQLVVADRLAAEERHPRHRTFDVLERVGLRRLCDHRFGHVRFRPRVPSYRALVDHRPHRQILTGHEHLLDVELRRRRGCGTRRRTGRVSQEDIRPAERENCDRPDDDQLPIHETAALRPLTLYSQDLDIVIVKVRLI